RIHHARAAFPRHRTSRRGRRHPDCCRRHSRYVLDCAQCDRRPGHGRAGCASGRSTNMKPLIAIALIFSFGCRKPETPPAPAPEPVQATQPATTTTAPPANPQIAATLPSNAPIPAQGVLLWLAADDALAAAKD